MQKITQILSGAFMLFPTLTMAASANNEYVSDWWHQSINIVGSNSTRFGPLKRADLYPEYRAWAHADWFDFYGYADLPKFFGIGNDNDIGIWDNGSPFFMEIEPRFSIDKLTGVDLSFGPFKEWYFAHNYIYDAGTNEGQRQSTWYMGIGTDIETGLPMTLSANIYAKYQGNNYNAANENEWDGYRFKVKYVIPITTIFGGNLNYVGFTNFDFGSDLKEKSGGEQQFYSRTNSSIVSTNVLSLVYPHWNFGATLRYFYHGGQFEEGSKAFNSDGDITSIDSTGWAYYLTVGYAF
ncbi:nucleoside-specific channel-forming protein Tsx [Citrobacter freundii]|uniref:nucleoside-specific channel-forming protein Tsx n=1 Tax=Citrobacter europaeus TaxID=1914243 RepID=UPI000947366F|nr:nucleoside-specific channel-forming protein Tsx [Citrobacter freundii]